VLDTAPTHVNLRSGFPAPGPGGEAHVENDRTDGQGTPPKDKAKDLDALRARLGLKDAKAGAAQPQKTAAQEARAPGEPQKIATDDFKLDFGAAAPATTPVSIEELDGGQIARPKGKIVLVLGAMTVALALAVWLGMQFGNDLGLRSLHNSGVSQARTLKGYFFEDQTDPTGQQIDSRVKAITEFRDRYQAWYNENITALGNLIPVLESGDPAMLAQLGDFAKVEKQLELLKPLIRMLEKYDASVDDLNPHGIFGDRVFHPEIAYKVVDYMAAANRLSAAIDDLRDGLTLAFGFQWSPEPPKGIKTDLVVWAPRKEGQDQVKGALVDLAGEPEEKKEVEEKVTYQSFKELFGQDLDIKVPKCGEVPEGEEAFDSYLVEKIIQDILTDAQVKGFTVAPQVFLKLTEQEVKRWSEVKVRRFQEEGDKKDARMDDLVQVNIRPVLEPVVAQVYAQYSVEMVDRALIFAEIVETLDRIKELSLAAGPENLQIFLEELSKQEEYRTF